MARSFHPYPIVGATKTFIIFTVLALALFVVRDFLGDYFIPAFILLGFIGGFLVILPFVASRFHTLTVEESNVSYHSGILSTRNIMLPYSRITEASYTQGLVQRLFGVGSLNLDTAGGADMAIRMVDVKYSDIKAILGEVKSKGGKGPDGM